MHLAWQERITNPYNNDRYKIFTELPRCFQIWYSVKNYRTIRFSARIIDYCGIHIPVRLHLEIHIRQLLYPYHARYFSYDTPPQFWSNLRLQDSHVACIYRVENSVDTNQLASQLIWISTQWRSQNTEKVTHIKGRLLDQALSLFNCDPFSKWELLLKERICSQREPILSFMSSSS